MGLKGRKNLYSGAHNRSLCNSEEDEKENRAPQIAVEGVIFAVAQDA